MYYSSGNYEALATPKKPECVDHKSAYIIGSGLAALAAACYLVRDGQMKGEHVHVFEKAPLPGGACDGYKYDIGYVMRGGREMANHFEVMWDLLRSIPSLETEGASVLDEYYWLNKADPNYSLCRATVNRGEDAHTDGKFGLSDKGAMEIMKLFFTPDEQLQAKLSDFNAVRDYINRTPSVEGTLRFFMGYSGWESGQLEQEIEENTWIVGRETTASLMDEKASVGLWQNSLSKLGGKYAGWSRLPQIPTLN